MIKKTIKKLLAPMMVLALAIGAIMPGINAAAENGSLPPANGTLTIHKYLMDDVSNAGSSNDGNVVNPSNLPASATPLSGITFSLYTVQPDATSGGYPQEGPYVLDDYDNPTTVTDAKGNVFSVTAASPAATSATDSNGVATVTVAQAVYLVVEQPDSRVASPAAPFVVAVPMTNPAGNGWITNVHAYPKNEELAIEKTADRESVHIGEAINFSLMATIPSNVAAANGYVITDKIQDGLTYQTGSIVVKGSTTRTGTQTVLDAACYSVVGNTGDEAPFKVIFDTTTTTCVNTYKYVEVEFVATANASILENAEHIATNQAQLTYTDEFDHVKNPLSETLEIHTGSIKIDKQDTWTGSALDGAKFKIASSEANAKDGAKYLRIDGDGKIIDYGEAGYDTASDYEVTTSGGVATFEGLKDYTGFRTYDENGDVETEPTYLSYWLVETQAPATYNLLNAPVRVTFDNDADRDSVFTTDVTVKNNKGFVLPVTGGIGVLIFIITGCALIGSALAIVLSKNKKAQKAKN